MNSPELPRRGLLGLLAALPIFARFREEGPPSFELAPQPAAGQHLQFTQRRRRVRRGIVEADLVVPITVDVMEVGDRGTILSWKTGATTIREASAERRASMELASASPSVPLVIQLDAHGCVQSLLNQGEVRDAYAALIDRLGSSMPGEPHQRVAVEQMLAGLKHVFGDERAAAVMSLREPQMLFSACGRRYGAGEPVQFDTLLQSPLDGAPIRALARFSIRKVDKRRGEAELGWLLVSHPGDTTAAADASVRAVLKPLPGGTEAAGLPKVELEERGDYRVDLGTAWPTQVKHVRRVVAGDVESVDSTWFERLPPAAWQRESPRAATAVAPPIPARRSSPPGPRDSPRMTAAPANHPSSTSGLRLRPLAGDADFPLMAAVANASFAADGIQLLRRAEDLRRDYAAMARWDPSRDIVMAEIDGELAGYARTWDWMTADGTLVQGQIAFVHPALRRRGVGSALMRWLEARQRDVAREHGGATEWLHQAIVAETEHDRARLLHRWSYQAVRHLLEMERRTLDDLPDFPLPPGFEVRPVLEEHLRAIHEAHARAVQGVWGYPAPRDGDFEAWMQLRSFQPHLWQVAWHVASNEVAGQVKPWIDAEQNEMLGRRRGYTEFISVDPRWRRRGLARALVVHALQAQKQAGMLESALGVDGQSEFGTTHLYEDCGFAIVKRNILYRKPVDLNAT